MKGLRNKVVLEMSDWLIAVLLLQGFNTREQTQTMINRYRENLPYVFVSRLGINTRDIFYQPKEMPYLLELWSHPGSNKVAPDIIGPA